MKTCYRSFALQYTDAPTDTRGGNSTAVSLGNNVAMSLLFAGMLRKTNSWLECLQSTGALLKHPVCKRDRPQALVDNGELNRRQFWGRIFEEENGKAVDEGDPNAFALVRNLGTCLLNPFC
jgi:hypothetical protein